MPTYIAFVLPITIDDLSPGFNIADFLTLNEKFETMMGFTQEETEMLVDDIYRDHDLDPATRESVMEVIAANYNGYRIVPPIRAPGKRYTTTQRLRGGMEKRTPGKRE